LSESAYLRTQASSRFRIEAMQRRGPTNQEGYTRMRCVREQSLPARRSLRELLGGHLGQGRCSLDPPRMGRQAEVRATHNQVEQISDTTTLAT